MRDGMSFGIKSVHLPTKSEFLFEWQETGGETLSTKVMSSSRWMNKWRKEWMSFTMKNSLLLPWSLFLISSLLLSFCEDLIQLFLFLLLSHTHTKSQNADLELGFIHEERPRAVWFYTYTYTQTHYIHYQVCNHLFFLRKSQLFAIQIT